MQPTEIFCKKQSRWRGRMCSLINWTKLFFLLVTFFMAVAAPLKHLQQGQKCFFLFFFFLPSRSVCLLSPCTWASRHILESHSLVFWGGEEGSQTESWVPDACEQLASLPPGFLSPQVCVMLPHSKIFEIFAWESHWHCSLLLKWWFCAENSLATLSPARAGTAGWFPTLCSVEVCANLVSSHWLLQHCREMDVRGG